MPEIKLKHVVSCSSEDLTHKADNLLKPDTYRKWKCCDLGEKQSSLILQFEKAEYIHHIDIGNEASAFVEVLVGNSTSACEQDFEVILVSSFFMSPTESRSGTNLNRVRMFGPDKLAKATLSKKWDRVKVVCTQPYNKSLAYGLSFIRLYSTPEDIETSPGSSSPKITKLGQFVVKEEDGSGNSLKPGSLFFSRASRPQLSPPTAVAAPSQSDKPTASYAAAALQASGVASPSSSFAPKEKSAAKPGSGTSSPKPLTLGKRKFDFAKERMEGLPVKKESPGEGSESSSKKTSPLPSATKKFKGEPSPKAVSLPSPQPGSSRKGPGGSPPLLKKKVKKGRRGSEETVEFHSILEGTVFVLSGFQNPFRSELRDKALEMGAKYKSDWSSDSTHLICAFANTPKYTQVKSQGGCVVRKDWILDCHKRKQRLSYKRYLLDGPESSGECSEGEEEDLTDRLSSRPEAVLDRKVSPEQPRKAPAKEPRLTPKQEEPWRAGREEVGVGTSRTGPRPLTPDEDYGGSTDEDSPVGGKSIDDDSGCDTEDELKRVQEQHQKKHKAQKKEESDPYAGSTDENTDVEESAGGDVDLPIPELPDLFLGKHFLLYGEFPNGEHRILTRYITAFNGALEEYMNDAVNYVVTAEEWDDRFDEALMENSNLAFVKPRWVYVCNEKQRMVPHQPYVVVPQL
ncbi:DNA repair protein XRCC1 isoform X2 [Scyliorhinus canicula]|uniref:DNA repair protein XRCC1 isoform X2 n=1 Tax=Scyliorhinus canicula TaxID=7830 RepID=UPI0018F6D306|nr:DNA repair protein XRCC1 isoform X2 [Scyliorhinus canicula]